MFEGLWAELRDGEEKGEARNTSEGMSTDLALDGM